MLVSLGVDTAAASRKEQLLFALLAQMKRVIVAYSGGADSAYLAWAAHKVLQHDALAVTADSPSIPESHKRDAAAFAAEVGFPHEFITTFEFDNPDYANNGPDRCFHCKDELFVRLKEIAAARGFKHIVYGVNVDDLGDFRPGQRAARLHGAGTPLVDAGLSKAEIRELSRRAGLSTWNRPAAACLSSRIPYGTPVTRETIRTIDAGEEALRGLGFRQFRVRFHGEVVRLEIAPEEMPRALSPEMAARFVAIFKPLGFPYVTLDLEGYRQGSLNEVLSR
jgi:uncharacterized protein